MSEYYISGGIGDALVYTCYFPEEVDAFHWRSRGRPDIEPVFRLLYPQANHYNHLDCPDDDAERMAAVDSWNDGECPDGVENWMVLQKFYEFRERPDLFHPSPILTTKLADVSRFRLPAEYYVCQHDTPYNGQGVRSPRQITGEEWASVLQHARGLPVVVIGAPGSIPVPDHDDIIDLVGETDLAESIEITKGAKGYAGIDSAVSIVASWLFPVDRMAVKYSGFWIQNMRLVYYRPLTDFSFLHTSFRPAIFAPAPGTMVVKAMRNFEHEGRPVTDGDILEAVPPELAESWIEDGRAIEWGERGKRLVEKVQEFRRLLKGLYTSMDKLPEYIQIQSPVVHKHEGVFRQYKAGQVIETYKVPRPLVVDWIKTGSAVATKKPAKKTEKKTDKEVS